jgi:retinal rod rhodopsin-sensitive cGMP 3',5'-cyclic phosphodiesterase subunit delta
MAETDQVYEQGAETGLEPSLDEGSLRIKEGFRINWMNMRDASTGQIMWEENEWDAFAKEAVAYIPKDILKCRAVSREINFSSVELMDNFRLVQRVLFKDSQLEEWHFEFGFVIPGSTNTWQQTIEATDEADMLPAEMLTGNVVIETYFYVGMTLIDISRVRLFYV